MHRIPAKVLDACPAKVLDACFTCVVRERKRGPLPRGIGNVVGESHRVILAHCTYPSDDCYLFPYSPSVSHDFDPEWCHPQ